MEHDYNSYSVVLRKLPYEELQDYITNPGNYDPDAVIAAVKELERRGLSTEETGEMLVLMQEKKRREEISLPDEEPPVEKQNNDLPVLYSRSSIRLFGILFSTFFGGILMAINLARLKQHWNIFLVLAFALIFSYATGMLVIFFPDYSSAIAIGMNILGVIILEAVFWRLMIGNKLEFKNQSPWVALLIGIGAAILFLWTMSKQGLTF